jgi:two-component system sensor histidine kinase MprB
MALLTATAVAIAVAACATASWFLVKGQLDEQLNKQLGAMSGMSGPPRDGGGYPDSNPNQTNPNSNPKGNKITTAVQNCSQKPQTDEWSRNGPDVFSMIALADGSWCTLNNGSLLKVTQADKDVAAGKSRQAEYEGTTADGTEVRILTRPAGDGIALMTAIDLARVKGPLDNLALLLVAVSALGVLGATMAGLLIARASLKPVDELTDAVETIARTEDLAIKIPVEGTDEIARLGRSFNTMTTALAASQERQQNLIADAGHELRTPLTSMRTNIDLLIKSQQTGRDLPEDTRAKMLVSLKAQMHEMTSLIGDLLQLGSPAARNRQAVEVALHEVASRAVSRARLRGPNLMVEARLDPWYVQGNPDALERAVVNLCDNAVKFSPTGGTVQVRLSRGELTVRDHGPGIPAAEIPYVFERFWRSPGARSLPGSGLGLSIVAQAVEEAHGKVSLETAPGGGALARLWLPGTPNPSSTRFS